MATSTPNLNLILPDYSDKADISVLNDNFQKIDEYCANGGVSNEELQNAVKAANAWANATASAESVSADNEADVNLTEGDNSKNLHFSIPRGQPGVLISETEPTDPNVKVWIKPDGEADDLEQIKSDVSSLKEHLVDQEDTVSHIVTFTDAQEGEYLIVSVDTPNETTVTRTGKNLYNPAAVEVGKGLDTTTGELITMGAFCVSPFIPISGVVSCTFSTSLDNARIAFYDENKGFLEGRRFTASPVSVENASAKYIRFHTPTDSRNAVQIELSATATTFESYSGESLTVAYPNFVTFAALGGTNHIYADGVNVIHRRYVPKVNTSAMDNVLSALPTLCLFGDVTGMSKDDAVTLNYAWKERSGTCAVKWQGSSSIGFPKKNYTIKFDNEFEVVEGWGIQKKYCFKANWVDASHVRNIVSAKLWGQIVKSRTTPNERLNALTNAGAIDGFPCIIRLNGEFIGLYTWNIPKDGWMLGMGSGANECIICANGTLGKYNSCGFQAPEAEFGQGFDLEYAPDEDNTAWALDSLNALINATMTNNLDELNNRIDWDSAYDYLILSSVIGHVDGIVKNYLLSTYDGVKWFFTGYDMDGTFGNYVDGKGFYKASATARPASIRTNHLLFAVINGRNALRNALKARYAELRADVLSEDNICSVIENFAKNIPAEVYAEERKRWTGLPSTSVNDVSQMRDWIRRRLPIIDADFEEMA